MWYQLFKYGLIRPYVRLTCRPTVTGEENIPARGGAILAANHQSALETLLLPASIHRRMVFPAKAELFRGDRGPASRVVAWFLRAVGQVPMDRTGGRASAEGLRPVLDELGRGGLVGIYPEGTRSVDGRLYKGHTGVARMAIEAGVPIIPVAMVDTQLVRRLGLPGMRHPRILIGRPIDTSRFAGRADHNRTTRWLTDEVMAAIQQMSGQTYVDVYGSRAKHGDLAGADLADRVKPRPGGGPEPEAPAPRPGPEPAQPTPRPDAEPGAAAQRDPHQGPAASRQDPGPAA